MHSYIKLKDRVDVLIVFVRQQHKVSVTQRSPSSHFRISRSVCINTFIHQLRLNVLQRTILIGKNDVAYDVQLVSKERRDIYVVILWNINLCVRNGILTSFKSRMVYYGSVSDESHKTEVNRFKHSQYVRSAC
jgi:hypothetical protein